MSDDKDKPKRKRQKPGDANYVNNKEFTKALDEYARRQRKYMKENNGERMQMSDYVASCIVKMSHRLCTTPRFSGYPYKDEMIQNGILAAVKYAHNFDGSRFDNGFAYVTSILFSHMIITIKKEKKMYETKMQMIQQMAVDVDLDMLEENHRENFIKEIADQKLSQIESQRKRDDGDTSQRGFTLRTGWTKESRDAYDGGTPLWDEDPDDI